MKRIKDEGMEETYKEGKRGEVGTGLRCQLLS